MHLTPNHHEKIVIVEAIQEALTDQAQRRHDAYKRQAQVQLPGRRAEEMAKLAEAGLHVRSTTCVLSLLQRGKLCRN
jgi:hypothetical protein